MGGEEDDHHQVRRGLEVVGEQPAWRGGRVPGQAEGVGGSLQPHHHQTLPARWSTRNAQRNAQRISQRWIKLWSNNRRSRLDPCYYILALCLEILFRPQNINIFIYQSILT